MFKETEKEKVSKEKGIDGLRQEIEQVDATISGLNQEKTEKEDNLKSLHADANEQKRNNAVLNQRVEGEIKIAQQILKTKINEHAHRVETANFNLVKELRNIIDQETGNNKLLGEMTRELEDNKLKCQELEDLKLEKTILLQQLQVATF